MLLWPMKLQDYIREQAGDISDADVLGFRRTALDSLTDKMLATRHAMDGQLWPIAQFLIRVAAEYDDFRRSASILEASRQAVFVLQYFLDENDAIPDTEVGLGFVDDFLIARTMVRMHEGELREFADACGHRWQW